MKQQHDGDCTIYSSMDNGMATDGICTCGYGMEMMRKNEFCHIYSKDHPRYVEPNGIEVSWEEFVGNDDN